jgi:hypothetical protein
MEMQEHLNELRAFIESLVDEAFSSAFMGAVKSAKGAGAIKTFGDVVKKAPKIVSAGNISGARAANVMTGKAPTGLIGSSRLQAFKQAKGLPA